MGFFGRIMISNQNIQESFKDNNNTDQSNEKYKFSFVKDLIDFEAKENTFWRKGKVVSVRDMLEEIVEMQKEWRCS